MNGKPALDWVMDRQCVKTDKASGIVNDANAYANETAGNPAYPLELFQRVITVSLETMKIVDGLPKLDEAIEEDREDLDDLHAAEQASVEHRKSRGRTLSLDELDAELGLED